MKVLWFNSVIVSSLNDWPPTLLAFLHKKEKKQRHFGPILSWNKNLCASIWKTNKSKQTCCFFKRWSFSYVILTVTYGLCVMLCFLKVNITNDLGAGLIKILFTFIYLFIWISVVYILIQKIPNGQIQQNDSSTARLYSHCRDMYWSTNIIPILKTELLNWGQISVHILEMGLRILWTLCHFLFHVDRSRITLIQVINRETHPHSDSLKPWFSTITCGTPRPKSEFHLLDLL